MAWDRSAPVNPKYQSREHREYRASLKRDLKRDGFLICTARPCILDSRIITNPNGNDRDGLTAGHNDDGVTYDGPQHRACNIKDGAVRASARSHGAAPSPRRWEL